MLQLVEYLDDYVTYENKNIEEIELEVTMTAESLADSMVVVGAMHGCKTLDSMKVIAKANGIEVGDLTEEGFGNFVKSSLHGIATIIKAFDKLLKKWLTKFLITVSGGDKVREQALHWYKSVKKEYGDIKSNYIMNIPKTITKSFFSDGLSGKETSSLLTFMLPEKDLNVRELLNDDKITLAKALPEWVHTEPNVVINSYNLGSGKISVFVDASNTTKHLQDSFVTKGVIKSSSFRLNEEVTVQDLKLDIGRAIGWLTMTKQEVRGAVDTVYDKYKQSVDLLKSRLTDNVNEDEALAIKKSISLAVTHYGKTIMSVRRTYVDAINVVRFLKAYGLHSKTEAVEDIAKQAVKNVDVNKEVVIPLLVNISTYLEKSKISETLSTDIYNYLKSNLHVLENIKPVEAAFLDNLEFLESIRAILEEMSPSIDMLIKLSRISSGGFRQVKLSKDSIKAFIKNRLAKPLVPLDTSKLAAYIVLSDLSTSTITDVRTALLTVGDKHQEIALKDFIDSGGFNVETITTEEDIYKVTGYDDTKAVKGEKENNSPAGKMLAEDEWAHMRTFLKLEGNMDLTSIKGVTPKGYKAVLNALLAGKITDRLESEKDRNVITALAPIITSGLPSLVEALKADVFEVGTVIKDILSKDKADIHLIEGFSLLQFDEVPKSYQTVVATARKEYSKLGTDEDEVTYEKLLGAITILLQALIYDIKNNASGASITNRDFADALRIILPVDSTHLSIKAAKFLIAEADKWDADPMDKAIYNRFTEFNRVYKTIYTGKYYIRVDNLDFKIHLKALAELSKSVTLLCSIRLTERELDIHWKPRENHKPNIYGYPIDEDGTEIPF